MKSKEVSNLAVIIIAVLASFAILAVFPLQNPTGHVTEEKVLDKSGSYEPTLTIDFGKEYTGVNKIEYEVTPGGEWCAASMEINVYDVFGRNVGDYRTSRGDTHVKIKGSFPLENAKVKSIKADAVPDANFWTLDCQYVDYFKANLVYEKDENPPAPLGSANDATVTKIKEGSYSNPAIDFGKTYQNVVGLSFEGEISGDQWWCEQSYAKIDLYDSPGNKIVTITTPTKYNGEQFKLDFDITTNQINLREVIAQTSNTYCKIKNFKATLIYRMPPAFLFSIISIYPSTPTTSDNVTIEAKGTDNMNQVEIYVDNSLEQRCYASKCSVTKKYSAGAHKYQAIGYSAANQMTNTEEQQFTVTAVPNTQDTTKPSINYTGTIPSHPYTNETVKLVATMYDNVAVTKVEMYINGTLIKTCTSPSLNSCSISPKYYAAGMHKYTVKAYDAAGNMKDIGGPGNTQWFTVTQAQTQQSSAASGSSSSSEDSQPPASPTTPPAAPASQGDTTPPTFSFQAYIPPHPASNDEVTVMVNSEDPSGVYKIEIFIDNALIKTCLSSPCSIKKIFSAGTHYYYAKSYDTANNVATSQTKPIEITAAVVPDTTPPRITISYAKESLKSKSIDSFTIFSISASAVDPSGIGKIDLYLNNNLVKTCTGTTTCKSESILTKLSLDKYTYHAEATDSVGNWAKEPQLNEAKIIFLD